MTQFQPGQVVYATLTCAHSDFPVRVTRRTAKSIWIEATDPDQGRHNPAKRCAVRVFDGIERATAWGSWHLSADSLTPNGFDPLTI